MPVSADLVLVYAANRPDDDTSTVGGAKDEAARPLDSQFTANAVVAAVSDGTDTRTLTIEGINSAGTVTSENFALTSTSEVTGSETWAVIGRVSLSAGSATRTVTIRQGAGGTTRHTLNPDETLGRTLFWESVSAGSSKTYYEKCFWVNTGATTLNSSTVEETADATGLYAMGLASAKDDSGTATNRLSAPGGVTFTSGSQNVPGGNLLAGEAIGVWFRMALGADQSADDDSITNTLAGTSA